VATWRKRRGVNIWPPAIETGCPHVAASRLRQGVPMGPACDRGRMFFMWLTPERGGMPVCGHRQLEVCDNKATYNSKKSERMWPSVDGVRVWFVWTPIHKEAKKCLAKTRQIQCFPLQINTTYENNKETIGGCVYSQCIKYSVL